MKASRFDFKGAVVAMLRDVGAVDGDRWYILRLETVAGPLDLCPQDNWLACRFVDVARARQVPGMDSRLNGYSGKWNFHPDVADAAAVADIRERMEQRLVRPALPRMVSGQGLRLVQAKGGSLDRPHEK